MTLKELKKMIAEEYSAFQNEQNMPPMAMGGPGGPKVDVSDDDVDATGGGDAEGTLKKIMDMLTAYFEGGDEEEAPEAPDTPDAEEEEEEEEDIEEGVSGNGFGKGAKEAKGSNGKMGGVYKENRRAARNKKMIAESAFKNRFKKLANIK